MADEPAAPPTPDPYLQVVNREVHIRIPRDVLRALMENTNGVPFQTNELGFPLRIVLWGTAARKPRRFKPRREEKEDE